MNEQEPVLCYVGYNRAYFTTKALKDQWGDDWNDAPYEHNAGSPYAWWEGSKEPPYQIVSILFLAPDLVEPSHGVLNSAFSVEDINAGKVPWLQPEDWNVTKVQIFAGTPISEFRKLIKESGGIVQE